MNRHAYEQNNDKSPWNRFWQSEQDDYQEGKYFPQRVERVAVSPTDYFRDADKAAHLILTLGIEPWCTSSWHEVYYQGASAAVERN